MWKHVAGTGSAHYSVLTTERGIDGLVALREMFEGVKANEMNFVLFSTSGVHGTYNTIEEAEKAINGEREANGDECCQSVTFLVVHPRLVSLRYGECMPRTSDDITFLKELRKNSLAVVGKIGMEDC